jgi:hypothetical protein
MTSEARTRADRRRLSAHAAIGDVFPKYLSDLSQYYFGISAAFLVPDAVEQAWLWVADRSNNLSGTTYNWSVYDRPHRVHRLLVVRDPAEIGNVFRRDLWQTAFRTFCHLHLRDGAVLYVVFLSERDGDLKQLGRRLNLTYFSNGILFPLENFWADDFEITAPIPGPRGIERVREVLSEVPPARLKEVIRIWYDRETFSSVRRGHGAITSAQRRLVHRTFAGYCQSPRGGRTCRNQVAVGDGCVDHILPLTRSNHILLNLTWLCTPCNLAKGDTETLTLPIERATAIIPSHLNTMQVLSGISLDPPEWLPRVSGRPKNVLPRLLR